jgi:hypothetical protein
LAEFVQNRPVVLARHRVALHLIQRSLLHETYAAEGSYNSFNVTASK